MRMLKDLLESELRLVVCGTAASTVSAARNCYYAGPGNKFWRVLHEIGLTNRRLDPIEYQQLNGFGIGLTDVVKEQSGNDCEINFQLSDPQQVRDKILQFSPTMLAFNGKKAQRYSSGDRRSSTDCRLK